MYVKDRLIALWQPIPGRQSYKSALYRSNVESLMLQNVLYLPPAPTEQKPRWKPEAIWTFEKSCKFAGPGWIRNSDHPARSLVILPTELSGSFVFRFIVQIKLPSVAVTIIGLHYSTPARDFLFSKSSRQSLGPIQASIQRVPSFFPGVNLPGREVIHPLLTSAEVTN